MASLVVAALRGKNLNQIKVFKAARRLYRSEAQLEALVASRERSRAYLAEVFAQSSSPITLGCYKVAQDSQGQVIVSMVPMLKGDQLELFPTPRTSRQS
jgi:hypothetical protein